MAKFIAQLINIYRSSLNKISLKALIISKKLYAFLNGDLLPVIRSGAMKLTIDNINYRLHEQVAIRKAHDLKKTRQKN